MLLTPAQIKPKLFESRWKFFFSFFFFSSFYPGWMRLMFTCVLGCFHSHISTQTCRNALNASVDSCAEIKSAHSVA